MNCTICEAPSKLVYKKMNGYIEGDFFDIYECTSCTSQFIHPMSNLQESYDKIYGGEDTKSIYRFYYYLARGAKNISNPLKMLSGFSVMFWAVNYALKNFKINKGAKILEIGSGLGYLVHALREARYDATGLEYSPLATKYSIENFGEYFECGDVFEYSKENQNKFDCIIATEVLEHVADPLAFCRSTMSMLKPGGHFILTTPNKDFEPTGTIWKTDYPPIHLWWYTEKALKQIAEKINTQCNFVSFEGYRKNNLWHWNFADKDYNPNKRAVLNKNGKLIEEKKSLKSDVQKIIPPSIYIHLVYWYHKLTFLQKPQDNTDKMYTMCVVLSKN